MPSRSDLGEGRVGIATLDTCDVELPGVREDGMSGRNGSESPEPRAGCLGAPAQRRHRVHSSHDGAKLPFDLAVTIPRDCLRPQYGDGFLGAPLLLCRPSKMRWPDHGGADATAQDKSPNPQGPGEP